MWFVNASDMDFPSVSQLGALTVLLTQVQRRYRGHLGSDAYGTRPARTPLESYHGRRSALHLSPVGSSR